jgi:hypothetical protein
MTTQTCTADTTTTAATAQAYMDQLVAELEDRGLQVTAGLLAMAVKNPAVAGTDPRGSLISPGMTQEVLLLDRENLGLTWWWVWPGMRSGERGAPVPLSQIEVMCPADDIELAAKRILNVVRLRDTGDAPGDDTLAGGE